ncbi:MAG: histidine phosphatase family protein [Marmoricola sp.]
MARLPDDPAAGGRRVREGRVLSVPPRRLVLLRHGRTAWNTEERMQGHTDVPLDEVGHRQSAAAAQALATLSPAVLWSSDLARARDTAAYVEQATGLSAVLDPRLREFDVGVRAGMTHEEFAASYPAEYAAWRAGEERPVVAGAESRDEVVARVLPALRELAASVPEGALGVAVMHGAAARVAAGALLDWPPSAVRTVRGLVNGGWAVLHDEGPDPESGAPRWRLEAWNRVAPTPIS